MDARKPLQILFPKVQIPPTRPKLVSRQRLLDRLDQGLQRQLTLISAPAGYGKSTLLSEWASTCEWPLGWISLEAGDNDLERFFTYLLSAVETAGASPAGLEGWQAARLSLQPLPLDAMLAILVNQLPSSFERLVIVLDDYHYIENQDIHGFVSALLDHLPPNIHIIIATRMDPPLRLARLRARSQLNEISEKDLRFKPEEAEAFFEEVVGVRLSREQVAELEVRTEGWITGLQLAGLSIKEREHPAELIETLVGTHRYILDYLMEEVFSDLPATLQNFLLRASILERLSPELCSAVIMDMDDGSGTSTSLRAKEILEFMDASNLFVVPLDSQRQWYRFHPLFAEFLHDRLASQFSERLPELHRRAAAWYADHSLPLEAVAHSFAAGDIEQAADLIQSLAQDMLTRGEMTTLYRWTTSLPENVLLSRPRLGLVHAWAMLMRDPLIFRETIETQIQQIASGFDIHPSDLLNELAGSQAGSERRAGLSEFAMLQAFAQRDFKDSDHTVQLFKAAFEHLPENELLLRSFTLAGLASTHARSGAIKQAEEAFGQAAQISKAAGSIYGFVASMDWYASMQAEQGRLKHAAANYHTAIDTLSSQGQRPLPLSGHVYVGLASVLLEWNHLTEALENVQAGLRIGHQVKDLDALLQGYVIQARILLALNKIDEAWESMLAAERQALETQSMGCIYEVQAWKAQLGLNSGEIDKAQQWAIKRGFFNQKDTQLDNGWQEIEKLTYARLLIATGQTAQALSILEALASQQEMFDRNRALIESLALQALCLRALGHGEQAIRTLARALLLAEPDGFVRVFIQEGSPLAALLRTAGAQGHSPDYVRHLLDAAGGSSSPHESMIEPLSERELEVLRLMADGLANPEIAAELVIAQSTVKTHINHIYNKLGVNTRTQAVARARQLQILS